MRKLFASNAKELGNLRVQHNVNKMHIRSTLMGVSLGRFSMPRCQTKKQTNKQVKTKTTYFVFGLAHDSLIHFYCPHRDNIPERPKKKTHTISSQLHTYIFACAILISAHLTSAHLASARFFSLSLSISLSPILSSSTEGSVHGIHRQPFRRK